MIQGVFTSVKRGGDGADDNLRRTSRTSFRKGMMTESSDASSLCTRNDWGEEAERWKRGEGSLNSTLIPIESNGRWLEPPFRIAVNSSRNRNEWMPPENKARLVFPMFSFLLLSPPKEAVVMHKGYVEKRKILGDVHIETSPCYVRWSHH